MIEKWREGYHVVYAQRIARQRERVSEKSSFAYVFYRFLRLLTNEDIPADTGDFCLMDRKVVDVLNSLPGTRPLPAGIESLDRVSPDGSSFRA